MIIYLLPTNIIWLKFLLYFYYLFRNESYKNEFRDNFLTEKGIYSAPDQDIIGCNCLYGEYLSYQESNQAYFCEDCSPGTYSYYSYDEVE